jgi:hypothetical protein
LDSSAVTARLGAYGLTLPSLNGAPGLVPAPAHWPEWHITWQAEDPVEYGDTDDEFTDTAAVALLNGGGIARLDRASATTHLTLPAPPTAQSMLHPHLSITALAAGAWLGRRTFHAGSFVHNGGVWGVLGDRERGKSSALAWLVRNRVPVFADDLLTLIGDTACAGPRILDLRPGAAEHFGLGHDLGVVGTRVRWRVELDDVPAELPFRGWVALEWTDADVRVEEVPMAQRLPRLVEARGLIIEEPSSAEWLPIIAKPMVTLSRPQDWGQIDAAMTALLEAIG